MGLLDAILSSSRNQAREVSIGVARAPWSGDDQYIARAGDLAGYGDTPLAAVMRLAGVLRDQLDAALDRQRAAIALHTESVIGVCPSCGRISDVSDHDDGLVPHPCPTVQALDPKQAT